MVAVPPGYAKQMGIETEREQEAKKHELKYVPTEWKAEQMDKKLVSRDVGRGGEK